MSHGRRRRHCNASKELCNKHRSLSTKDICRSSWVTFRPRCKITCFRLPANLPSSLPGRQKRPRSKLCVARAHHRLTQLFHGLEVHLLAFRAPRARPGARREATCLFHPHKLTSSTCQRKMIDKRYKRLPDAHYKRLKQTFNNARCSTPSSTGCLICATKGWADSQRKMWLTSTMKGGMTRTTKDLALCDFPRTISSNSAPVKF